MSARRPRWSTDPGPGSARLWVSVLVIIVVMFWGGARQAWAHNALISVSPEDGSSLAAGPAAVVLTFNEPALATGTAVLVTGPGGSVTDGDVQLVDTSVRQPLVPDLDPGTYTVEWRVASADGHPITGSFTFSVTKAASSPTPSPTPTADEGAGTGSPSASATSSGSPLPSVSAAPASPDEQPVDAQTSPWWWLLAAVPVGLAALLGWRFSRSRR